MNNHNEFTVFAAKLKHVFTTTDLAQFADVSKTAVDNWLSGKHAPSYKKTLALGELAAVTSFLKDELSFNNDEARIFSKTVIIDPETYEAVPMFNYVKQGHCSFIIQKAIELSIEG
jgi:transcriptional regulator with XRE-family HTH domain